MLSGHIRHGEIVLAVPRARNPCGRGWAQRGMQMLCGLPYWVTVVGQLTTPSPLCCGGCVLNRRLRCGVHIHALVLGHASDANLNDRLLVQGSTFGSADAMSATP